MRFLKTFFNRDTFYRIKYRTTQTIKTTYQLSKQRYLALNKPQRIVVAVIGVVVLLLIVTGLSQSRGKPTNKTSNSASSTSYPVHFDTPKTMKPLTKTHSASIVKSRGVSQADHQLQTQLTQLKSASTTQMQALQSQLQAVQSSLDSRASQQAVQQLQQTVTQPNPALLGKMNDLQQSVQVIQQQTAKKIWVDPKTVSHYFRLVAVQGFSDGMRAIIDVNGNQTTLSTNEICPACRGWVLLSMDFANQSAIFTKKVGHQTRFVKLQAN